MLLGAQDETALSVEPTQRNVPIVVVFTVLAIVAVALRFYCKSRKRASWRTDDWLIIAALAIHLAQAACAIVRDVVAHHGQHEGSLSQAQMETYYKTSLANRVLYAAAITLARCSICCCTMAIFTIRPYQIAGYGTILFDLCWLVFSCAFNLARCMPITQPWDPQLNGSCVSEAAVVVSVATWGMVCDLISWLLPLPWVWSMKLSRRSKIGITATFSLGLVVVATAAARIGFGLRVPPGNFITIDAVYTDLSFVETSLAITTACLPMYKPLLDLVFPEGTTRKIQQWKHEANKILLIQKVDRKTGLPVKPLFPSEPAEDFRPTMVRQGSSSHGSLRTSMTNREDRWVVGSGRPGHAGTAVSSAPVILERSAFDPLPRFHEVQRETSVPEDEIRITQEVEVSFV